MARTFYIHVRYIKESHLVVIIAIEWDFLRYSVEKIQQSFTTHTKNHSNITYNCYQVRINN